MTAAKEIALSALGLAAAVGLLLTLMIATFGAGEVVIDGITSGWDAIFG